MRRFVRIAIVTGLLSSLTLVSAQPVEAPRSIEVLDSSGFSGVLARSGNLYISSQPDEAGLERLAAAGVTTVINLRRPDEMANLPFDEVAAVERLGMRYVHVPQGSSEYPYAPEALDRVSEAIEQANGQPVLLHCASGARASHMFAAWLYRERGVPLADAINQARQIGFRRLPVEELLDTEFEMRIPEETGEE